MIDAWNALSLAVCDFLLGWLLLLPRDLTLLVVATFTALVLLAVRKLTTNQDRLRRAADDGRRLQQLIKEAKSASDKPAVRRHRTTRSLIAMVKLKAELWPLLASLVPIAMLATWALFRLEYLPVKPGEEVELDIYTPATVAGEVVHVVPEPGLKIDGSWVQKVRAVTDADPPHGQATWKLHGEMDHVYPVLVRVKDRTLQRELIVSRKTYALPVVDHGEDFVSEWKREPYYWLGYVGGIEALALPAWLIGYVVMVVPITLLLKRVLGVY